MIQTSVLGYTTGLKGDYVSVMNNMQMRLFCVAGVTAASHYTTTAAVANFAGCLTTGITEVVHGMLARCA